MSATDDPKLTGPGMTDYLVFECVTQHVSEMNHQTGAQREYDLRTTLHGYNCIGSVRAKDEMDAVRAVMQVTRRISKYAVLPAVFIDFSPTADADGTHRPQLNP
jgi:hypothetical protein